MPGPSTLPRGNVSLEMLLNLTLSPASVANATSAEQTFSCPGLIVGDHVSVSKPTTQGGLGIVGSRVSAADVLAVTFGNFTSATITPTASQVYVVRVTRCENTSPPAAIA
jgi:hypothetical protein